MADQTGFEDRSRGFLRLTGTDARDFLQNLVTADLEALSPGGAIYGALLTPQGKYLYDFVLIDAGDGILLDADTGRLAQLNQRLALYKLRRDVEIAPADWRVALFWGGEAPAAPAEGLLVPDPRTPTLGWRLYWPGGGAAPDMQEGDPQTYEALRLSLGVPATDRDLIADESYILEAGFAAWNGVSFTKGCYVGQEVTARMRHKTELRKGLKRVRITGPAEPGAEVTAAGRPAGVLRSRLGDQGLAQLRFDRARRGDLLAGEARLTVIGEL